MNDPNIKKLETDPRTRFRFVSSIISTQMPKSRESALMLAIFDQACNDVFLKDHRDSARRFFSGQMECLSAWGIDPDWVRSLIKRAQLWEIINV